MALPCLRLGTDRPQEQRRQVHHPTKLANTLPAGPSNAFPLSQNSLPPRLAACTTASFLRKTWMATSPRNGFRWQTCSVASEYKVQRNEHTRANDDAMVFCPAARKVPGPYSHSSMCWTQTGPKPQTCFEKHVESEHKGCKPWTGQMSCAS